MNPCPPIARQAAWGRRGGVTPTAPLHDFPAPAQPRPAPAKIGIFPEPVSASSLSALVPKVRVSRPKRDFFPSRWRFEDILSWLGLSSSAGGRRARRDSSVPPGQAGFFRAAGPGGILPCRRTRRDSPVPSGQAGFFRAVGPGGILPCRRARRDSSVPSGQADFSCRRARRDSSVPPRRRASAFRSLQSIAHQHDGIIRM